MNDEFHIVWNNIYLFKVNNRNTQKKNFNNKNTRTTSITSQFLVLLLQTLNIFHIFFSVSCVDAEQVNVSCTLLVCNVDCILQQSTLKISNMCLLSIESFTTINSFHASGLFRKFKKFVENLNRNKFVLFRIIILHIWS